MRRNVPVNPLFEEPVVEYLGFPGLMLSDELHLAVTEGVGTSVAATVVFDDEGEMSVDPMSDIRTNRLDLKEAEIVAGGKAFLADLQKSFVQPDSPAQQTQPTDTQTPGSV